MTLVVSSITSGSWPWRSARNAQAASSHVRQPSTGTTRRQKKRRRRNKGEEEQTSGGGLDKVSNDSEVASRVAVDVVNLEVVRLSVHGVLAGVVKVELEQLIGVLVVHVIVLFNDKGLVGRGHHNGVLVSDECCIVCAAVLDVELKVRVFDAAGDDVDGRLLSSAAARRVLRAQRSPKVGRAAGFFVGERGTAVALGSVDRGDRESDGEQETEHDFHVAVSRKRAQRRLQDEMKMKVEADGRGLP